jgi:hypothetical protein
VFLFDAWKKMAISIHSRLFISPEHHDIETCQLGFRLIAFYSRNKQASSKPIFSRMGDRYLIYNC